MTEEWHEKEILIHIMNVYDTSPVNIHCRTTLRRQQLLEQFMANIRDKDVIFFSVALQGHCFVAQVAFHYPWLGQGAPELCVRLDTTREALMRHQLSDSLIGSSLKV